VLGGAEDGINGAGLNALGATNTLVLTNHRNTLDLFNTVFGIQGLGLDIEQVSQGLESGFAAGRTLVDGIAIGNGFGVRTAAGEAALYALALLQ